LKVLCDCISLPTPSEDFRCRRFFSALPPDHDPFNDPETRIMRTTVLIAASAVAFATAFAFAPSASAQQRAAAPIDSISAPLAGSAPEGGGNYAEDFESFTVGPLAPQDGWTSDWEPNANVVDPGLAGSSRAAFHTMDGSNISGFEMISPVFPATFGYIEVTQVLEGSTSLYQIITQDPTTEIFNTRINFETDGSINAGVLNMTGDGLDFLPTTGSWTPGEETRIGIQVTDAGELFVFQDGEQIFAGTEVNFALSGTPGEIGAIRNWAENFSSIDTQTWDNIRVLDEPPRVLPEAQAVPVNASWTLALLILCFAVVGIGTLRRFA
jgi:hypothetical protein